MEHYDIAVVGLGGIGSATAWFAARSGRSVIGLERFALGGHHHGASHDHSRIIRHSYHTEHYVHLTRLAYDAWRQAEAESGAMPLRRKALELGQWTRLQPSSRMIFRSEGFR